MATTNVREFRLGIGEFISEADDRRKELTKVVAMRGLRDVVLGTRVDTGRARGNWQVDEGNPPTGQVERLDQTGGVTIAAGANEIGGASGKDIIWLHNGVPYIDILEGWDGMVVGAYEALRTWIGSLR